MKIYGLEDILTFGKHEGEQIEDMIEDHPHYMAYLYNEDIIEFSPDVIEKMLKKKII